MDTSAKCKQKENLIDVFTQPQITVDHLFYILNVLGKGKR